MASCSEHLGNSRTSYSQAPDPKARPSFAQIMERLQQPAETPRSMEECAAAQQAPAPNSRAQGVPVASLQELCFGAVRRLSELS